MDLKYLKNKHTIIIWEIIFFNVFFISNTLSQDFQVSTSSAVEYTPRIAADSSGNFIIVWVDYRNTKIPYGGTGSDGDIYGQRYSKVGNPIGGNFRISDDRTKTNVSYAGQIIPRISMNKKGKFVVTWIDNRPNGTPSDPTVPLEFNIYAQRYDQNAHPIGGNFLVNDTAKGGQLNPDVLINENGSFLIIWEDTQNNKRLNVQVFDSTGTRIGQNKNLNLFDEQPRIAPIDDSSYIVVTDSSGQLFSFPSTETSSPFSITPGYNKEIQVSEDKRLYIALQMGNIISSNYEDFDIFLEEYNLIDKSRIKSIKVNDDQTDYWQVAPTLSLNKSLIFVAWQDYRNGWQLGDGNCIDIYGQRYNTSLLTIGINFKVSHESNESAQV